MSDAPNMWDEPKETLTVGLLMEETLKIEGYDHEHGKIFKNCVRKHINDKVRIRPWDSFPKMSPIRECGDPFWLHKNELAIRERVEAHLESAQHTVKLAEPVFAKCDPDQGCPPSDPGCPWHILRAYKLQMDDDKWISNEIYEHYKEECRRGNKPLPRNCYGLAVMPIVAIYTAVYHPKVAGAAKGGKHERANA